MRATLLRLHLGLVCLILWVPLLLLAVASFQGATPTAAYEALWRSAPAREAALLSLVVAGAAAFVATVLGTLLALGLHGRRRHAPALEAVAWAPLFLSDVVLGVALLSLYAALEFTLGAHSIVLSHVTLTLAFVAVVVRRRLGDLDWRMVEASEDLGAGGLVTFGRVTLPLILPAVAAGALLALALSLGDYLLAALAAGPDSVTLTMLAYAMIRDGALPEASAIGTLLLLAVILLVLLAERLSRPPSSMPPRSR